MNSNYPFSVLFEDNHLLVVNKSPGVLVQGDITGDIPLVELAKDYIKEKYQKPGAVFLGVVHRIDRPVSGVVVFARTSKALERMNKIFQNREVIKTYMAIVSCRPPREQDTLVHWLKKDTTRNKSTAYSKELPNTLRSELSYQLVQTIRNHFVLRIQPLTGRPHQIRVQCATINCPIVGDIKYGADTPNMNGSIYLHAGRLEFIHPVTKSKMKVVAPFPNFGLWNDVKEELL